MYFMENSRHIVMPVIKKHIQENEMKKTKIKIGISPKKVKEYFPDAQRIIDEIAIEEKEQQLKDLEEEKKNLDLNFVTTRNQDNKGVGLVSPSPNPSYSEDKFYKRCPKCNKKVKHSKVYKIDNILAQEFTCKNKKCDFHKIIKVEL